MILLTDDGKHPSSHGSTAHLSLVENLLKILDAVSTEELRLSGSIPRIDLDHFSSFLTVLRSIKSCVKRKEQSQKEKGRAEYQSHTALILAFWHFLAKAEPIVCIANQLENVVGHSLALVVAKRAIVHLEHHVGILTELRCELTDIPERPIIGVELVLDPQHFHLNVFIDITGALKRVEHVEGALVNHVPLDGVVQPLTVNASSLERPYCH